MFDIIVFALFIFVQWRLSKVLLRLAGGGAAARAWVIAFNSVALAAVLCGFSRVVTWLGVSAPPELIVGAFALAYVFLAAPILAVHLIARRVRDRIDPKMHPGRRRAIAAAGNALMVAPFAAIAYGFIHRTDFHVRELDMPVAGLPPDLAGLRILQISDIHLSPFLSERELARVIDAAAGLHPHLTVITGDLISARGDPLDACIRQLARLRADAGVLGCMGNHERYARAEDYAQQAAARAGIDFLRGRARALRFGNSILNVAGVDHQSHAGGKRYLNGAGRMVLPGAANLLLSHNPDVFPVAARQGYNLMLAGHTHGGQVTVEILDESINPARFLTPYVYGFYRAGAATAFVTRGIGTIGIPARIGAPPEICVLRLRKA